MSDKKTRSIQRAVDVAAKAFQSDDLKNMSINLIAKEARCSTATLYEVFGSKIELYRVAAQASIEQKDHPRIEDGGRAGDLDALFAFCEARIAHLASHERGRSEQLLNSHFDISGPALQDYVRRQMSYIEDAVREPLQAAMNDGFVRPLDIAAAVHAIVSGTGFTPMVAGNYRLDDGPDCETVMRRTFAPLLTSTGQDLLEIYLAGPEAQRKLLAGDGKPRLH